MWTKRQVPLEKSWVEFINDNIIRTRSPAFLNPADLCF